MKRYISLKWLIILLGWSVGSLMSCQSDKSANTQTNVVDSAKIKQTRMQEITDLEHRVFNDSTKQINITYVDPMLLAYARFSTDFPADTMSPIYLMRAARLAMSVQKGKEAVLYFNKILVHYKNSKQAPMALFLKAFTYEQLVNDTSKAKKYYNLFIERYPDNKFAQDAKEAVRYLGIPDSVLIKQFENK